jgi:hypothetical protein
MVQSCMLHFCKIVCNCTLLLTTVEVFETFLEAILRKAFELFGRILNDVSSMTIAPSFHCSLQSRKQVRITCRQVRTVCSSVVTLFFTKKSLTKTDRCAGALSCKRKKSCWFEAFPSDRVTKATKIVNMLFFIHNSSSCELCQRIPEMS